MKRRELQRLGRELHEFLGSMVSDMGGLERRAALSAYLTGLLLDGDRKSVEPMAARLVDSAAQVQAMRQRLAGCISESGWSDEEMRRRLARKLERELPGLEALVIDDTGFVKKGTLSVGVARQYSGTLVESTIARLRPVCTSRASRVAVALDFSSTSPSRGRRTARVARKPECRRRSRSCATGRSRIR